MPNGQGPPPQFKLECWTCSSGPIWVRTERDPGEAKADWCARHDAAVAFWMGVCPPV